MSKIKMNNIATNDLLKYYGDIDAVYDSFTEATGKILPDDEMFNYMANALYEDFNAWVDNLPDAEVSLQKTGTTTAIKTSMSEVKNIVKQYHTAYVELSDDGTIMKFVLSDIKSTNIFSIIFNKDISDDIDIM